MTNRLRSAQRNASVEDSSDREDEFKINKKVLPFSVPYQIIDCVADFDITSCFPVVSNRKTKLAKLMTLQQVVLLPNSRAEYQYSAELGLWCPRGT